MEAQAAQKRQEEEEEEAERKRRAAQPLLKETAFDRRKVRDGKVCRHACVFIAPWHDETAVDGRKVELQLGSVPCAAGGIGAYGCQYWCIVCGGKGAEEAGGGGGG